MKKMDRYVIVKGRRYSVFSYGMQPYHAAALRAARGRARRGRKLFVKAYLWPVVISYPVVLGVFCEEDGIKGIQEAAELIDRRSSGPKRQRHC